MPSNYRLLGSITAIFFCGLLVLSSFHAFTVLGSTVTTQVSDSHQNLKGLVIDPAFTVYHHSGSPSMAALAGTRFTVIGTMAYVGFHDSQWTTLRVWVQSVHEAGFLSLVDLTGDQHDFSTEVTMAVRLAAMSVDIISLDEPISMYKLNQQQLRSGLESILRVNGKQEVMITEYNPAIIQNVYAWTTSYVTVRIATDEYDVKSVIDFGIQQASRYGKRSTAWLTFEQGSQNFDCYVHLDQWLSYVKEKSVDVFFWYVDTAGTWEAEWYDVASFRSSVPSADNLRHPVTISLNADSRKAVFGRVALKNSRQLSTIFNAQSANR